MLKRSLLCFSLIASISACSSITPQDEFSKPKKLLFINNELNTIPLQVQRDERLCDDEKSDDQNCPIKFFIDDFKAGEFYINNSTTYYLKPNEYELTVKNCKEKCDIYHTKVIVGDNMPPIKIVLSLDKNGKPIIINQK